jgi:predicted RNA-binding protein with PUA-like domain
MKYWLLKTEPDAFSIDDLEHLPHQTTSWEGVRNYQARNLIREMSKDDMAFFYHSSCQFPGVVGVVKIVKTAYPDGTALNPSSPYYDPKSSEQQPRWYQVDVQLVKKFRQPILLQQLRSISALQEFILLRKGNRLSILPVTEEQWHRICQMAVIL